MKYFRFAFYALAVSGVARIAWKYGPDAWVADPLASIVVGLALLYACTGLVRESMGWRE